MINYHKRGNGKAFFIIVIILLIALFSAYYSYQNAKDAEAKESEIMLHVPEIKEVYEVVSLSQKELSKANSDVDEKEIIPEPIKTTTKEITASGTKEQIAHSLMDSEHDYFILQFIGPVKKEWLDTVKKQKVELYDYIPEYSYKAKINSAQIPELLKLKFIQNIIEYTPELKIPAQTAEKVDDLKRREEIALHIETFGKSELAKNAIQLYSEGYVQESKDSYQIKILKSNIDKLAQIEGIDVMEEMAPVSVFNDFTSDIVDIDTVASLLNLNGNNQIIATIDSGVDTGTDTSAEGDMHLDIDNRVVNISIISNAVCQLYGQACTNSDDKNGHGTHTSGSVVGNGTRSSGQYQGAAPKARLSFYASGDDTGSRSVYIASLDTTMIQTGYRDGARIHSDSWGSSNTEYSNALAKRVDSFMWDNDDMLIIVAAGNDGSSLQTVRDPGTAKNVLTVGASQSNRSGSGYGTDVNTIASFSSRGPANDGRIKPDVVAPGTNIVSTKSSAISSDTPSCSSSFDADGYYSTCSGTSMATPAAAGFAALVRQNLIDNLDNDYPRASLIKALMINGAVDIGYGIPSNHSGWGRINLTNTITPQHPRSIKYIDNSTGFATSGAYNLHDFNIINSTAMLKFTLVWTDYESSASAGTNLVNDLDLIITSPNGTKYYGNNFVWPYNSAQDRLNNVEQVILYANASEVEIGTYSVNVSAFSISYAGQNYSLVISGGFNATPIISKFDGTTSSFDSNTEVYSTPKLTLENSSNGKIAWNNNVYSANMNFDKNVKIARNNVYVNTSALHTTLNSHVNISLYNLSFASPLPLKDNGICAACQIISSSEGNIAFSATGFSNYSSAENTSIEAWDQQDAGKPNSNPALLIYQNQEAYFYANYTNKSSSLPVTSATCSISFNDTVTGAMSYNAATKYYEYNRTFAFNKEYNYTVSCSAANFYPRNSSNMTTIYDINSVYPWQPTNHTITALSNGSVVISWNKTKDASSYGIFYDADVDTLWGFSENSAPNITTIEISYTETPQSTRFYKIIALNATRANASNTTLGVFKKTLPVTTGSPNNGVEQVIVSVPLNVTNTSLNAVMPSASQNDVIYTFDTDVSKPLSSQYYSNIGWVGSISTLDINQGYTLKPVQSTYTITFVGFVPVTNSTLRVMAATNTAGNLTPLTLVSLNTPRPKCDLDAIFYKASAGDKIYRYNYTTASYEVASFNGLSWSGDFDCILPGEGYEMRRVTNGYNLSYER